MNLDALAGTAEIDLDELLALAAVGGTAASCDTLDGMLAKAVDAAARASRAREAFIVYLADEGPTPIHARLDPGSPALGPLLTDLCQRHGANLPISEAPFDVTAFFRSLEADLRAGGMASLELLPVSVGGENVGLLGLLDPSRDAPCPALMQWIPLAVSLAIGNYCAFQEAQHHLVRQSFVREVSRIFTGDGSLDEQIGQFLARLEVMRGLDASRVVLADAESRAGRAVGSAHLTAEWEALAAAQEREVARRTKTVYVDHLAGAAGTPRTYLGIPLVRREAVLGVVSILGRQPAAFARRDRELFESLAEQLALHVENALLEQQRLEAMRARIREEAASKAKSEFLALMSHELRTPLTAVLGFTEVLLGEYVGPLEDKQREYLGDILQNGHHLLALINDVLDLAKVEAGRVELALEAVDLPAVLAEVRTALTPLAQQRRIRLDVTAPAPPPALCADRRRLVQILLNLTGNALKFARQEVWLKVHAASPDSRVRLEVRDDGVGISAADQERLFEPFFQAASAAGAACGTGLGLSLTRNLVHLHGGDISLTSAPGRGSSFYVDLPQGGTP